MNTADLIAYLRTVPQLTIHVDDKICNARIPTLNVTSGEIDVPYLWLRHRNIVSWDLQNPELGTKPLGMVWDAECVADSMTQAEEIRDAIQDVHGYVGPLGDAHADLLEVLDQDDDYAIRNASDDAGVFVCSLLIQAIGE